MFRISDILKKHKKGGAPEPAGEKPAPEAAIGPEPAQPAPPPPGVTFPTASAGSVPVAKLDPTGDLRFEAKQSVKPEQKYEGQSAVISHRKVPKEAKDVASAFLSEEAEKESAAGSTGLYNEVLSYAKTVYTSNLKDHPDFLKKISSLADKAVTLIAANNRGIQILCLEDYRRPEDYFYYHITNVFFMAIDLGIGMGYDRTRLVELGAGAFLHDIGMKDMPERDKQEPLDNYEYGRIKQHPEIGAEILKKMNAGISKTILDIVQQEHERSDGSGYPTGSRSEEIGEDAQIVGLVDSYEAMAHQRPYRPRYTALETISIILKNKKTFGQKTIKTLILRIGVFPLGTLVVLNTKEIGIIVKNRPELPFRPAVHIIYDSYGKELKSPKEIDLAENPIIYIDDCVKEERDISDYRVVRLL